MKNNETALIILIILIVIFLFSGVGMMGFGGMMNWGTGFNFMWFGWIFMTLIIIALVLFIIWLIKQIQK